MANFDTGYVDTYTVLMGKTAPKKRATNNLTLSLDEDLLKSGREYASKHGTSLNNLIRTLLSQTVLPSDGVWIDSCFRVMDRHPVKSSGRKWRREDLYDV